MVASEEIVWSDDPQWHTVYTRLMEVKVAIHSLFALFADEGPPPPLATYLADALNEIWAGLTPLEQRMATCEAGGIATDGVE